MSQQPPQQPGFGPPQQPGWGAPPQPPKKNNAGKIIGIGCGGIVALLVIIGVIGALVSGGDSSDTSSSNGGTVSSRPTAPDGSEEAETEKEEPAEEPALKITAEKTGFTKSILADGSNYTSIKVTVTNNSDDTIGVNPLYFTITDTDGTKHTHELAVDETQIDTVDLAPGENISGTVTGKGKFTAAYVTYTDGLLGDPVRVDVS